MYFILKKSRKLISGACGNMLGIVRNFKIYIENFIIMKEFFVKDDWYLARFVVLLFVVRKSCSSSILCALRIV